MVARDRHDGLVAGIASRTFRNGQVELTHRFVAHFLRLFAPHLYKALDHSMTWQILYHKPLPRRNLAEKTSPLLAHFPAPNKIKLHPCQTNF